MTFAAAVAVVVVDEAVAQLVVTQVVHEYRILRWHGDPLHRFPCKSPGRRSRDQQIYQNNGLIPMCEASRKALSPLTHCSMSYSKSFFTHTEA